MNIEEGKNKDMDKNMIIRTLSKNTITQLNKAMLAMGDMDMILGRDLALAHLHDLQDLSTKASLLNRQQTKQLEQIKEYTVNNDFDKAKKLLKHIDKEG